MDCFAFPIKFSSGRVQSLTYGSYEYYRQMLTLSILTELGEHPITPDFGIFDPSFIPVEPNDFILNAARFIPEIEITGINVENKIDGSINVEFSFKTKA
jgi:hypothetical protein